MPFSPINFLTERRKTKPKTTQDDELAVIKAAAWAWYERGSGSEGKPIREFDFTNSRKIPVPSRYKIEAMKNPTTDENSSLKTSRTSISMSSCPSFSSSTLMDKYDIESISKDLDHYIESCDHDGSARVGHVSSAHHRRVVAVSKIEKGEVVSSKVKSKKLSKGGFLLRHAAVCGSLNDVVASRNNIVVGIRGRRQPVKRAPVVNT